MTTNQEIVEEELPPVEKQTIKTLTSKLLKRTYDMFVGNFGQKIPLDETAQKMKITSKVCTLESIPYTQQDPAES